MMKARRSDGRWMSVNGWCFRRVIKKIPKNQLHYHFKIQLSPPTTFPPPTNQSAIHKHLLIHTWCACPPRTMFIVKEKIPIYFQCLIQLCYNITNWFVFLPHPNVVLNNKLCEWIHTYYTIMHTSINHHHQIGQFPFFCFPSSLCTGLPYIAAIFSIAVLLLFTSMQVLLMCIIHRRMFTTAFMAFMLPFFSFTATATQNVRRNHLGMGRQQQNNFDAVFSRPSPNLDSQCLWTQHAGWEDCGREHDHGQLFRGKNTWRQQHCNSKQTNECMNVVRPSTDATTQLCQCQWMASKQAALTRTEHFDDARLRWKHSGLECTRWQHFRNHRVRTEHKRCQSTGRKHLQWQWRPRAATVYGWMARIAN